MTTDTQHPIKTPYRFICPVCKSPDVETNTAYCWFMKCRKCGWFTNEYK